MSDHLENSKLKANVEDLKLHAQGQQNLILTYLSIFI
jgi:hypothetical protein